MVSKPSERKHNSNDKKEISEKSEDKMTKRHPCLLQLKASKLCTAFFCLLESSATRLSSIWEGGIAYGPQGHISESAALCETATIQLTCNYFYLLRMCKMIQSIKIVGSTSNISIQESKKKCFLRHAISG